VTHTEVAFSVILFAGIVGLILILISERKSKQHKK